MCCWIDCTEPPVTLVSLDLAELRMSNIGEFFKLHSVIVILFQGFFFLFFWSYSQSQILYFYLTKYIHSKPQL